MIAAYHTANRSSVGGRASHLHGNGPRACLRPRHHRRIDNEAKQITRKHGASVRYCDRTGRLDVRFRPDGPCNIGGNAVSIIAWLILGLIAGFIASKIVNKTGEGAILDIVLGIVGAVVGGFLFSFVGAAPVTGFNIYSLVVAVIGAIVVLVIYHAIVGRRVI